MKKDMEQDMEKDKEKGEEIKKVDYNMVERQEQDEPANQMALKYFWFPVLISGARISLYQTSQGGGSPYLAGGV